MIFPTTPSLAAINGHSQGRHNARFLPCRCPVAALVVLRQNGSLVVVRNSETIPFSPAFPSSDLNLSASPISHPFETLLDLSVRSLIVCV